MKTLAIVPKISTNVCDCIYVGYDKVDVRVE